MTETRSPRSFDVTVCAECRQPIKKGTAKVSRGTGWVCQECAYALAKRGAA